MSWLMGGGGRNQPSSQEKIAQAEQEMEMISDMFNRYAALSCPVKSYTTLTANSRLTQSCSQKCIPADYREADLNKGESVCLDRCVAKFFEVNMKVSEKMQQDAQARGGPAAGAGGMMGM